MRKGYHLAIIVALVLCGAGTTQAHDPRIAVFAFDCYVPLIPGLHTHAALVGRIKLSHRTVRFVARCFDGPAESQFPTLQWSDGSVQSIDMSIVTSLKDDTQQRIAWNRCHVQSRNGFLTFNCAASEADGGEVHLLVSIPPLQNQAPSAGTTP